MASAKDRPDGPREILTLRNISCFTRYNTILKNLDFSLRSGEIHAILGENGCGKSTLGKIICGVISPDSGDIEWKKKARCSMVHQERICNNDFCVWEYLYFDNDDAYRGFFLRSGGIYRKSVKLLERYGISITPDLKLRDLKESDYLVIELLRQIEKKPDIIILDEVFVRLESEYAELFTGIFRELKRQDVSIILITHDIEKLYNFADRVSIIRNGEILYSGGIEGIDKVNMIRLAYTETVRKVNLAEIQAEFYHFLRFNEAILNTLPITLAVIDPQHEIIMANRAFETHFGIGRDYYLHRNFGFIFPDGNDDILGIISASLTSKEIQSYFDVHLKIGGRESVNNLKIVPIYDGVSIVGNIIIIEDVTDYYNLQKKLMLSENLSSVGMLAAGVGHEINNSLEIVFNYLRFIETKVKGPETDSPMRELKEELNFISGIVSRLVNFSAVNVANAEEFDLNHLVRSYINLVRKNSIYGDIVLRVETPEEPLIVCMNKNELRQVIINLVKNSCEAVGASGSVTVKTAEISDTGTALVQVTDNGPGIEPSKLNSVFLPFFSTKKPDSSNLGLGLSLCYSIIRKSNGEIRALNLPEGGCRFEFELPLS